jgi:hypothetical protein
VEQVPIESFEMPDIEDDAMTFGNGPIVERIGPDQGEEGVALTTGVAELRTQFVSDITLRGKHSGLLLRGVGGRKTSGDGRNQISG